MESERILFIREIIKKCWMKHQNWALVKSLIQPVKIDVEKKNNNDKIKIVK